MFHRLAKLSKELESEYVNIELEARFKIQKPIKFEPDFERTITYLRSTMYPSIIFRKSKEYYLESKEIVEKVKLKDINVVLSVEQSFIQSDVKFPLIEVNKRKIYRKRISEDPIVEITKCGYEFNLEIEFNINNWFKVESIIKEWKSPYWPSVKPMEISSTNLAKKLSYYNEWCISVKADGEHILIYENESEKVLLHDNGFISDIEGKEKENIVPKNIYEAEIMENKNILIFDCLMYNYKNIMKLNYVERRKYIDPIQKKDVMLFNSVYAIKSILYEPHNFKSDGYIITNIKNRNLVYKSKFKNTVDLRFKNGYLLLENEKISDRVPKISDYEFKEDSIYEFDMDMNLIRERKDKTIANYKFPYDDNPIYKIVYGIGVPSLRCFHNKIKITLLSLLPKTSLLDIGSGKGGDINKWYNLNFNKIYAVDPILDLREHSKNVIEIRDYVENVPESLEYDSVSILFVPWHDSYFKIINKSKNLILACMSDPVNYDCESFKCNIDSNIINLNIPFSSTSENVTETKISYKNVINNLKLSGWKHEEIKYKMEYGTLDERKLANMYSYHYMKR
uniref:Uncharacterized protein n=1 Tax=Debaryomyces hansenii TaxID=4959 RepID=A0A219YH70_DEBHN|nr:hypothetical protein [Debaryomyces hansenii]APZ80134.1 hypothetical protein [Debaryomyces hansenii]